MMAGKNYPMIGTSVRKLLTAMRYSILSFTLAPAELKTILEVLPIFNEKTCVRFKPYKAETSYLQISLGTL